MTAKRGKRNLLLWGFVGIAAAGVSGLLFQWLRPSPPIRVSPQTTYLTTPLRGDGLPDYKLAQLQRLGHGVSPEDNAAVLFWQAMGRGDWDQADWIKLGRELGFEPPQGDQGFSRQYDEMRRVVQEWLLTNHSQFHAADVEYLVTQILDRCQQEPWRAAECPPLAHVILRHSQNYDLLHQAVQRQAFYSPSFAEANTGFGANLRGALRKMIQVLVRRANLRIAEGEMDGAWTDLRTALVLCWLPPCDDNADLLVQVACEGVVCYQLQHLLADERVSQAIVEEVIRVLERLPHPIDRLKAALHGDRLDSITWVLKNHRNPLAFTEDNWLKLHSVGLLRGSVDWNVTLEKLNASFDELDRIFALGDRKSRRDQLQLWSDRASEDQQHLRNPWVQAIGYINPGKRSRIIADELHFAVTPYPLLLDALERAVTLRKISKVAAKLTRYRLDRGSFPKHLHDLVPEIFAAEPQDEGYGNPLQYQRLRDNEFLLYSLGPNGRDDEGSSQFSVYRGLHFPSGLSYFGVMDVDRAKRFFEQAGEPPSTALLDSSSWAAEDADDISWRTPLPPEPLEELVKRRVAELAADENGEIEEQ